MAYSLSLSRSTWACELKFGNHQTAVLQKSHAPRERVSWNLQLPLVWGFSPVTLHVSVWVEIWKHSSEHVFLLVTLHVSVWVEITTLACDNHHLPQSRSTWACELKCICTLPTAVSCKSRSTWACELKCKIISTGVDFNGSRSTWACELKFLKQARKAKIVQSRSTWACELK